MFKLVVASLVAGSTVVLAGWYLLYAMRDPAQLALQSVELHPDTVRVPVGAATKIGEDLVLTLDATGEGVLLWPVPNLAGQNYPLLQLQFRQPPAGNALGIFWKTTELGQQMAQHWISGSVNKTAWLQLGEMEYWSDTLVELALVVRGERGGQVIVQAMTLHPASPLSELRALYSDWMEFTPWTHTSINYHTGVSSVGAALYPLPFIAALMAASLLFFLLLRLATRFGQPYVWRVTAALFLISWLALDLAWQGKLLQQLLASYGQFAGKDSEARLLAGPDAVLVGFMTEVRERINTPNARVFIASEMDYAGMRANYYLYPLNVYWQRKGDELPARSYLRSGDYIVMINPASLSFDSKQQSLLVPGGERIPAALVFSGGLGNLFRVM